MNAIFDYTDYRLYLREYYTRRKAESPCFSYQYFADRAGFKSKTFLYKLINGEKSLSAESLHKVARAIGLKKREISYFEIMVRFTDAKSVEEKDFQFRALQQFSKNLESSVLRQHQFDYFTHWYTNVIRELVVMTPWNGDFAILGSLVSPPITAAQAQSAVANLVDLGLIVKNETGAYEQVSVSVTTGTDIQSLAVKLYQKKMLHLAAESVERHDPIDRDISTLTVGISESGVARLKEELALFRKKLIGIVADDNPADRVYQINFQMFPLSTPGTPNMPPSGRII